MMIVTHLTDPEHPTSPEHQGQNHAVVSLKDDAYTYTNYTQILLILYGLLK